MIDLHCHLLPGLDDGARDIAASCEMARAFVTDGVEVVACTPHIFPGIYHNTGPQIREAVGHLQRNLEEANIPLRLVAGADNHVVPDFVQALNSGHLLSLNGSRYVLVEPPHHVAPLRLEDLFLEILWAGYVPILTHPERLTWIKERYDVIARLVRAGVWMQVTSGSLYGAFGRDPQYWAHRMLDEGCVHILATDAHDSRRRPPDLARRREWVAKRLGDAEANHLVWSRPSGILANTAPHELPLPGGGDRDDVNVLDRRAATGSDAARRDTQFSHVVGRLRRFFG